MKHTKAELLDATVADARSLLNYCYGLREIELGAKVENLKADNAKQAILSLCQCIQNKIKSLDIAD